MQTYLIYGVSGYNLTTTNRGLIYKGKVLPDNGMLMAVTKKKLEILHMSKEKDLHYMHGLYVEKVWKDLSTIVLRSELYLALPYIVIYIFLIYYYI